MFISAVRSRRGFTLVDLAVCLLVVALATTALLAQRASSREIAFRVKCASNLRQIGQAILLYSNENKGRYPRAKADVNTADKPTAYTDWQGGDAPDQQADPFGGESKLEANDVTAALFLLLRTQDIGSDVFICPSSPNKKWNFGGKKMTALNNVNFPSGKYLSYSYVNPYGSEAAISKGYKINSSLMPDFAVAADMNPGGEELLTLSPDSPAEQMQAANNPFHLKEGQNVLYGDGHVEFQSNPLVGVARDNIYTYGVSDFDNNKSGQGVVGSPVDANDSILLPTLKTPPASKPPYRILAPGETIERGKFPLHEAAGDSDIDGITELLAEGAKLDGLDDQGRTPLVVAVMSGDIETLQALLDAKADPNGTGKDGLPALHVAIGSGNPLVIETLLAGGADAEARDALGWTPLGRAALTGSPLAVEAMLAHKVDVNAANADGFTPLHAAVISDSGETVSMLIRKGANVNSPSAAGISPLRLARTFARNNAAQILTRVGARDDAPARAPLPKSPAKPGDL